MRVINKILNEQFDELFIKVYIPMDAVINLDDINGCIIKEIKKQSPDFNKINILVNEIRNILADLLCDDFYSASERDAIIKYSYNLSQFIHKNN